MKLTISAMTARRAALAVIALGALVSTGCSKKLVSQLVPNQAPEVRLTGAPLRPDPARPDFYAYTMQWVGYDPDGRVDHFLYAVDPPNPDVVNLADTTWHSTAKNEQTFFFSAGHPIEPVNPRDPKAEAPHVFAVYAVDNLGAISTRPAVRGFFSFTQCPIVQVSEPAPTGAFTPTVTPTVTIKWTGQDPDGQFTTKPVRWVFRLFGSKNADYPAISDFISFALVNPDSLRKLYAPEFPGWTSVGADTTSFQYHNLVPSSTYLFVVTGFDEAGAYDPVFSPSRNMLKFSVTFAGTFGPIITMFNQFFNYTYPTGGYDASESHWFRLEVPADIPVTFNWIATAPPGADIRRYRWVLDLVDLSDQTPRSNESTDWYHWSAWSRNTTSATIGPFVNNAETHLFYIEAEDNNGLTSLGIIYFRVVRSTFEKDLLFVDDTRLRPDFHSTSGLNVDPPAGPWPTAAELDTFLFAKGGYPWKSYPTGTLSTPGIFNGYDYDTIGTRGVSLDGTVPLSFLGHYKHVVWYTDETSATYTSAPSDPSTPISALRLVNSPGRPVILSTYMAQGGNVWLAGGGAAFATLIPWNKTGTSALEYTARDGELIPGRMMFDFAHWQESIQMLPAIQAKRFGTTTFGVGTNRPGRGWPPNPIAPTPPAPPNYALLPVTLQPKNIATDPAPPLRDPDSYFYRGDFSAEYISKATFIREDYNDDPDLVSEFSTLDTLYITSGGTALQNAACMTYYHGREVQPFVFSGLNFWYWRRTQCLGLVDWVLQSVWGLPRDGSAPRSASAPMSARRAAR
jgi:hypothetical protein